MLAAQQGSIAATHVTPFRYSHKTEAARDTPIQPAPLTAAGLTSPMQAWAQVAHLRDCSTFRDLLSGALTASGAPLALHLGKNVYQRCDYTLAELEAGGGQAVAALLLRAAQLPSDDMAADMCVDACWEKLHTGSWSEVPLDTHRVTARSVCKQSHCTRYGVQPDDCRAGVCCLAERVFCCQPAVCVRRGWTGACTASTAHGTPGKWHA